MFQVHNIYFDDYHPNWHISWRETSTFILILVCNGQLLYDFNGTKEVISKGDIVLISPGTFRTGFKGSHPPHQKYSLHFNLEQPLDIQGLHDGLHDGSAINISKKEYKILKPRNFEYLRQRFNLLHHVWKTKSPYYYYTGTGIAMELLGSVLHEWTQVSIPHHKVLITNKIEQYIIEHYKEEIKIGTLAELVSLTPNYVSSIFKEVTGQTIVQYIHQMRMDTAQDLLVHSNMNIAEISNYLGFCDPSYFNRVFKKMTGQAPSSFTNQKMDK